MPTDSRRIYLDHAATTPLREEVRSAMAPYLADRFGNPSSLHAEGREARRGLEEARAAVRDALSAADFEVIFTSGGTESDHAAILGAILGRLSGGAGKSAQDQHVVAGSVEHAAVHGALEIASLWGVAHTLVPADRDGRIDPQAILSALRPQTILVSLMGANNEVGTLQPIRELSPRLRERGIAFHCDAIQVAGKLPASLDALPVDALTLSAHKLQGPKGAGALILRRGLPFGSWLRGGAQEEGRRSGTPGVAGAVGLARALTLAVAEQPGESLRLEKLHRRLREGLLRDIEGARPNTPLSGCAPHILSVSFERVEGESLLLRLDQAGIAVSTGSACNAGARKPSHVLQAMGRTPEEVRGSIRFSMGQSTTEADVDAACEGARQAVRRLRELAPASGRNSG